MPETELGLRLAECLAARLCHEWVGPLGAIANGVELLAEDSEFAAEATALVARSSGEAVSRLHFYRLAYGATVEIKTGDAEAALLAHFAEGRHRCEWPAGWRPDDWRWVKLALNLFVVAMETLPRGGVLRLSAPGPTGLVLSCIGENVRLPPNFDALADPGIAAAEITPRTVQTIFTAHLARGLGAALVAELVAPDLAEIRVG
jgi:histidine phosphotransferase ChpT